ncbi:hypothetical protein [Paenibacillus planticolens]|uniref:Lipid/polyisoprenoid-binding YceI-like domain-containing protein n=1 Tax=Paenibacillus planticolens TaxID=2654976 RepID=A0ABX1ZNG1_9BACL|nr:hypothetical protein [Paenibacillus planticolens]NOV01346.1 hypothetical protein [Paenibacillus planticolens]
MTARPLQGFDVSVTVVGVNGPALVGEFEEMSLNINSEAEAYMTLNSKMPIYLDGEVTLDGTLKRGYIDAGGAVKAAFDTSTLGPDIKFTQPRYVISADFNVPEKGLVGRYNLSQCIIDKIGLSFTKGKAVVNSDYSFKAEGIEEV